MVARPGTTAVLGIVSIAVAIAGIGVMIAYPNEKGFGFALIGVGFLAVLFLGLWIVGAGIAEKRAKSQVSPETTEAHGETATGKGDALDAPVKITDSVAHLVIPGPGNPTLPQVGYQTEGRRHFAYGAFNRRPKAIRFSKPEDRLLRSSDLPFEMSSGSGQIVVEKFYADGVVIDEIGSVGDPVAFVAYFDD